MKLNGKYTDATIYTDSVEENCVKQIQEMTNNPAFSNPIVIMPDTHSGKGSVIGFTMKVSDKVVPNTIGVDVGCGMVAIKTQFTSTEDLGDFIEVDKKIRSVVPLGFDYNTTQKITSGVLENKLGIQGGLSYLTYKFKIKEDQLLYMAGTLGGGNHFIEIAQSSVDNHLWLIIHTGSRNFGKKVCDYHQSVAVDYINNSRKLLIDSILLETAEQDRENKLVELKRTDLFKVSDEHCWLTGKQKDEYLQDMGYAQKYAKLNRSIISDEICNVLGIEVLERIESVHNYIDFNDSIIRKGAIKSYSNQKMIIPFNMKEGSIIAIGKDNNEWNYSAPHGAGRIMSRSQANKEVKLEDFKEIMKGVWSSSVNSATLDESPFAYKSKEDIEKHISETAGVLEYLKPVYNLKDSNFKGRYDKIDI